MRVPVSKLTSLAAKHCTHSIHFFLSPKVQSSVDRQVMFGQKKKQQKLPWLLFLHFFLEFKAFPLTGKVSGSKSN